MASSSQAWVRDDADTYGHGKYPHGLCGEPGCDEPACFEIAANSRVCLDHKPQDIIFVPFLGQQTKMYAATERWVLAGGGAGPGKTYMGARLWLKQHGPEHERWERGEIARSKGWFLFTRRTTPELLQVVSDFKDYCYVVCPRGKWNEQKSLFACECGYKVQFGGMEDDDDWRKYFGNEYTMIAMDEAWQNTVEQIEVLDSRLRCSDAVLGAHVQMYLLTTPMGSQAKQWMKRKFKVKQYPSGEVPLKEETKLRDGRTQVQFRIYIPSNLFDNPALLRDGQYEANLSRKSAAMRQMLLHNNWAMDQGAWVGDDWDSKRHVITPHGIPSTWPCYKEADYGYSSKGVVHWMAVDPNGGVVCYRSWSFRKLTAREMGERIKEIESQDLYVNLKKRDGTTQRILVKKAEWDQAAECSTVRGPMDAAIWARSGEDGESRGEILESLGTGFYKSSKGTVIRHNAAERIRWRLRNLVRDPFDDTKDVPALRFFKGTTENIVYTDDGDEELTGPTHTLPALPADKDDPDVPDTKSDDHDWDALAYGTGSRPLPGEQLEAEVLDFLSFRDNKRASANHDW